MSARESDVGTDIMDFPSRFDVKRPMTSQAKAVRKRTDFGTGQEFGDRPKYPPTGKWLQDAVRLYVKPKLR
jgi:hypothetical protein